MIITHANSTMGPICGATPTLSTPSLITLPFNSFRKQPGALTSVPRCSAITIPNNFIIPFYINCSAASIFITAHCISSVYTCITRTKNIFSTENFLGSISELIKPNPAYVEVNMPLKIDFHERKTCIYYHNETDRRRANFDSYSHELCTN